MSESILSPEHYLDAGIFRAEQQHIFRKLWIFAGVRQLLAEADAFLTRTIGGVPVVIQNCGGQVRAFENRCAHRQMPIQFEDYGQRRLACRYHGWTYGDDGAVRSIPQEDVLSGYAPAERAQLCLQRFAVRTVGNFVFVNLAASPAPLETNARRRLLAELEAISGFFLERRRRSPASRPATTGSSTGRTCWTPTTCPTSIHVRSCHYCRA